MTRNDGQVIDEAAVDANRYSIRAHHDAYAGIRVHRALEGRLDRLALRGTDAVVSEGVVNAVEVFHLGDGITAHAERNGYSLTHPNSRETLILRWNEKASSELVHGWNGSAESSSVASEGFGAFQPTTSVRVTMPGRGELAWSITRKRRLWRR